jgi:acetoacetyl-CoA reductase
MATVPLAFLCGKILGPALATMPSCGFSARLRAEKSRAALAQSPLFVIGSGQTKNSKGEFEILEIQGEQNMSRVAVVTGGTRGIGEAISIALKKAGYKVAANYMGNDERAKAFSDKHGIPIYKFNVADFDAVCAAMKQIAADLGTVEIVVNNAGITRDGTMKKMARAGWDEVVDTNLGGCFNMCKAAWDGMLERGFGRVVNIGSINGQAGQYGQVNYAAAKSGIHGFTKALSQEGAAKGITVNAIAPGYIDTDMVAAVPPDVLAKIVAKIPVGRLGKAEEIARGVLFLVADDAGFVTGSTMSINGGQHMY